MIFYSLESKQTRIEQAKKSLLRTAPDHDERDLIHTLFLDTIDDK